MAPLLSVPQFGERSLISALLGGYKTAQIERISRRHLSQSPCCATMLASMSQTVHVPIGFLERRQTVS